MRILLCLVLLSTSSFANTPAEEKDPYLDKVISNMVDLANFNIDLKREIKVKYRHQLFSKLDAFKDYYPKEDLTTLASKIDANGWYSLQTPKDAVLALKSIKKRPLIVVFDSIYCGYCDIYKKEVLSKKEINDRLENLVRIHVDVQTRAGQVFATLLNSSGGTPRTVFVDPNKDILESIGGYVRLPIFKKYLNELGY